MSAEDAAVATHPPGRGSPTDVSGTSAPAVKGEGLRVVYRRRTVVDVDSISIPAGRTYALLGASGAGKSTLLRVLGLLERPTAGRVLIDGKAVDRRDLATRRTIAAVFQKPYLLRGDVSDNVGYGLSLRGLPPGERSKRVAEVLRLVGMEGWEGRSALTLSGGEAQRIALARALVLEPRLLLLDEPLSYMDPLLKRALSREFAQILRSEHVTALYVTHDQDEAEIVADAIGIMREGRIVTEGSPDSVLGMPENEWHASFLGMEPALPGVIEEHVTGLARIDCQGLEILAITDLPVGTEVLVGIRPEDVLLFEPGFDIPRTSAQNRVEAAVAHIEPRGATARVVVVAHGQRIAVSVSAASAVALRLEFGSKVTLLFKATAVRLRRNDHDRVMGP